MPRDAASKGGIGPLIMAFANAWAAKWIQANVIARGYIVTDNTEALRADPDRSASILGRIRAGRWSTPEDFAGPVVFLACASSDHVSGTILTVDGEGRLSQYQPPRVAYFGLAPRWSRQLGKEACIYQVGPENVLHGASTLEGSA